MRKITVEGTEINFNDLTQQKQEELYKKNKKEYKKFASKSIYYSIRMMVARDETESSELLNEMLRNEINNGKDGDVLHEIFDNKIFEIEEDSIVVLSTSKYSKYRKIAAKLSKDSKLLNQMLIREIENWNNKDVINAIINNDAFEIEEKTIKLLATSNRWIHRKIAAKLLKDSKFLNEMYRKEIKGETDEDVENVIINNKYFKIEEETIKDLAASIYLNHRKKAAEFSRDSSFLNEMFRKEINGKNKKDVINAIINNDAFEIEEETRQMVKALNYCKDRQVVAKFSKDSDLLIEIFIHEIKMNYTNMDIIRTILNNEAFILDKAKLLQFMK